MGLILGVMAHRVCGAVPVDRWEQGGLMPCIFGGRTSDTRTDSAEAHDRDPTVQGMAEQ
jgi:hypothetical protein